MTRLGEYLQAWGQLLGGETAVFKGMVKGSVVLRASVAHEQHAHVEHNLRNAANDGAFTRLAPMLHADGIRRATIINRRGEVLAWLAPLGPVAEAHIVIYDEVDVDGCVIRVEGKDKTSHIGLIESGTGRAISVQTTSDTLAREFAGHYRNGWVRVRTEGTWQRGSSGRWEPKSLIARSVSALDDAPAEILLQELVNMPGNGWSAMPLQDALAHWRQLRGLGQEEAVR